MPQRTDVRLAVVLSFSGNWADTRVTMRALAEQSCQEFRLLVGGDEASTAPAELTGLPFVTVDHSVAAIGQGATHILFLDGGTEFGPDFLSGWRRVAAETAGGLVCPLGSLQGGPGDHPASGGALLIRAPEWELIRPRLASPGCCRALTLALHAQGLGLAVDVDRTPALRIWSGAADFVKSGLLTVRDGRVLLCRKKHTTSLLILPGGVREANETPEQCLRREVEEELAGVTLGPTEWLGVYVSPAAVEGKTVQVDLFAGVLEGEPHAASEIKELIWFGPGDDPALLAPSLRDVIFPDLRRRGLIP